MARLIGGQVNDASGEQVVGEPTTARAEFPGQVSEDDATQAGQDPIGPMTVTGGRALARAAADRAVAQATVGHFEVAEAASMAAGGRLARAVGTSSRWPRLPRRPARAWQQDPDPTGAAVTVVGAFADGAATATDADGTVATTVAVGADRVEVMGQLVLEDLAGTAAVAAVGDHRRAQAELTIGAATVADVPVSLDHEGVTVAGEHLVAGADVDEATAQLNAALEAAGIQVRLLDERETVEGTRAAADSGGIGITVTTPSTEGVPRNVLSVVVARGSATIFAEPASPSAPHVASTPPVSSPTSETATRPAGETPSPDGPGRSASRPDPQAAVAVGAPPSAQASPPQVAPGVGSGRGGVADRPALVVAGRTMSARTAYAGFAAWLLFTSAIPLVGIAWLGRAGRS